MFRRIRKGWEIVANGVVFRIISGRAAVQIAADKAVKIEVRQPKKRQSGLQSRQPRS
jgi:hypothetical protein